jgi:hypothetical protein
METTSSLTSDTFSFEFPSWENSKQRKHDWTLERREGCGGKKKPSRGKDLAESRSSLGVARDYRQ